MGEAFQYNKKYHFISLVVLSVCLLVVFSGCKKTQSLNSDLLQGKWKVALTVITSLGVDAPCEYISQPSDLNIPATLPSCVADDIWQFSQNEVTIDRGTLKCQSDEVRKSTMNYSRSDDDLSFDGTDYKIILLTKDTLILDFCQSYTPYDPTGYLPPMIDHARLAHKFYRVK